MGAQLEGGLWKCCSFHARRSAMLVFVVHAYAGSAVSRYAGTTALSDVPDGPPNNQGQAHATSGTDSGRPDEDGPRSSADPRTHRVL